MAFWDNWDQTWSDIQNFLYSGDIMGQDPASVAKRKQQNESFIDWLKSLGAGPASGAGATAGAAPTGPGSSTDLQSLYQSLYQNLTGAGASGSAAPAGYYTPDGVWINDNSPEDAYYRMVDAIWTKIYGQHPPFSMVQTFHDLGVENTSQLDTIMKQMPSHITNPDGSKMPIGQYDVIKGTAETFSDKYFGRPIPDQLIQDWAKQGITDPESIELWFLNHPAKDIPKDVYGQIFDAAAAQVKQTWNDLPHPNTVSQIYQNLSSTAQSGGATILP